MVQVLEHKFLLITTTHTFDQNIYFHRTFYTYKKYLYDVLAAKKVSKSTNNTYAHLRTHILGNKNQAKRVANIQDNTSLADNLSTNNLAPSNTGLTR